MPRPASSLWSASLGACNEVTLPVGKEQKVERLMRDDIKVMLVLQASRGAGW